MSQQNNISIQTNVLISQQTTLLEKMLLTDQSLTVSKRVHAKERGRKSPNE